MLEINNNLKINNNLINHLIFKKLFNKEIKDNNNLVLIMAQVCIVNLNLIYIVIQIKIQDFKKILFNPQKDKLFNLLII